MPGRALPCSDLVEGAPFRVHPQRESNARATCSAILIVARTRLRKLREEVTADPLRITLRQTTEASRIRRGWLAPDPEAAEAPSAFEGRGTGLSLPGPEPPGTTHQANAGGPAISG